MGLSHLSLAPVRDGAKSRLLAPAGQRGCYASCQGSFRCRAGVKAYELTTATSPAIPSSTSNAWDEVLIESGGLVNVSAAKTIRCDVKCLQ